MTSKPLSPATPPFNSSLSARWRLADKTSLKLGGAARSWTTITSLDQLRAHTERATRTGEPQLVLGGGSNLVCADEGFEGRVLEIALRGIHVANSPPRESGPNRLQARALSVPNAPLDGPQPAISADSGDVWLHVAAGEPWDAVVAAACRWGWAGIECLSGIPGKAGATPIQNVGAYGQELADCLWEVTCLDRQTGELLCLSREQCELGYRHSRFKAQDRDRFVVIELVLRLLRGGQATVRYPELARQLATSSPALSEVRSLVLATRHSKSMLLDPNDPNGRNCGSFFVNPIVSREQWQLLQQQRDGQVPHFEVDARRVKIPAAWLIEQAGFARGHREGNVGLSSKHTLCLIAHEGATSNEFIAFAHRVRDTVLAQFGIELRPEPILVGMHW